MKSAALNVLTLTVLSGFLLSACDAGRVEPQMDWQPPAWELIDAKGEAFRYPEDLDGPAVVLFWASWCPYCKALMPYLKTIVEERGGDVPVLALNIRDDEDPRTFMAENGFEFRLFPGADPVAEAWGVKSTPGLFLVDAEGRAVFSNYAIPAEDYPEDVQGLVEELKHWEEAAIKAPFWAEYLRHAIDRTLL
ncbi:MAG: TlpA family protein disulfide reductase [Gammaproteobacteria bacterium]|nr:TlpA family protein disulfide reductase [Gammaproteobacteria bacterium]